MGRLHRRFVVAGHLHQNLESAESKNLSEHLANETTSNFGQTPKIKLNYQTTDFNSWQKQRNWNSWPWPKWTTITVHENIYEYTTILEICRGLPFFSTRVWRNRVLNGIRVL